LTEIPAAGGPGAGLHVALLGSRGIPGRYGGYETLMEELAGRLVERGFRVTVYCRAHFTPRGLARHRGAELVVLPTVATKYLDTPVHTLLSAWDAAARTGRDRIDAALLVNSANALFVPLLQAAGVPVALHVDGIEKRRAKWGPPGRAVYALSERLACNAPDALVTDAEVIRRHYRERHGADSWVITYGVEARPPADESVLAELGLASGRYFLYVSRFEPENNPHRVAEAYRRVGGELPLVMVGGAPYASRFIAAFTDGADPRIRFPGPIYGEGYRALLSHALAYVHATEVGGTHPALVEAMGYGNCLVVNDAPENREVAGGDALWFRAAEPQTLADALEQVRRDPAAAGDLARRAAARARRLYSWDAVTDRYEALFRHLAAGRSGAPVPGVDTGGAGSGAAHGPARGAGHGRAHGAEQGQLGQA
jgi:glycosyltransferase involved in cell wall biosynthesis